MICTKCFHWPLCRLSDTHAGKCDLFVDNKDVAVVKPGEWLTPENDTIRGQKFMCSVCGKVAYYPQPTRSKNWVKHCGYEYCPKCGAKMDGKDKDNGKI